MVKPVVVYQMPPADGAAQGVKFDLTVVLCSLMNMLTTDLSRSQDVMAVMRLVASVGSRRRSRTRRCCCRRCATTRS